MTAGQVSECTRAESVIGQALDLRIARRRKRTGRRCRPRKLAADKGYSAQGIRAWLGMKGIKPVIPHKVNELARKNNETSFDREAYRGRAVVEQCVGWLKEYRRIGTRFEKLAVNYHGMLQLAIISEYLKLLF